MFSDTFNSLRRTQVNIWIHKSLTTIGFAPSSQANQALPLKWKQFKHKLKIYLNIQSNFSHKQNNYLLPFSTEPRTESLLIALKWKWFKVIWELLKHNFSHLKTQFQKSFVLLLQNIVVCAVNSGDKISLLLWCVLKPKLSMDNLAFKI